MILRVENIFGLFLSDFDAPPTLNDRYSRLICLSIDKRKLVIRALSSRRARDDGHKVVFSQRGTVVYWMLRLHGKSQDGGEVGVWTRTNLFVFRRDTKNSVPWLVVFKHGL